MVTLHPSTTPLVLRVYEPAPPKVMLLADDHTAVAANVNDWRMMPELAVPAKVTVPAVFRMASTCKVV
jgi:hypothetical protein